MGVVPFFWLQACMSLYRGLVKSTVVLMLYPVPMFMALISKDPRRREVRARLLLRRMLLLQRSGPADIHFML